MVKRLFAARGNEIAYSVFLSLLADTILPADAGRGVLTVVLGGHHPAVLVADRRWATCWRSSLGIGRSIMRFQDRWFTWTDNWTRALGWYSAYGAGRWLRWFLGGRSVTVVAGVMREPRCLAVALVTAGKGAVSLCLGSSPGPDLDPRESPRSSWAKPMQTA